MAENNSLINDLEQLARGYQSMQNRLFEPTVPTYQQVPPPPIPPPMPQSVPLGGAPTPRSTPAPNGFSPSQQFAQAQQSRGVDPSAYATRSPFRDPTWRDTMNPAHGAPYGVAGPPTPPPPPLPPPPQPHLLGAPHMRPTYGIGNPAAHFGSPNPYMRGFDAALDRGQDMQAMAMMSAAERMRYGGNLGASMVANRVAATGGAVVGGAIGYGMGGAGGGLTGADIGSTAAQMFLTRPIAQSQLLQRTMGAFYRPSIDTLANGAQIQLASRNFVSQGAELDISGRGLSSRAAMRVSRGLEGAAAQSQGRFNQQDMQNIMLAGAEEGLFDSAQSSDALIKNVKRVSKMLGTFSKITGDPDFRNNIRLMSQLKTMGVDLQNQDQFLSRISGNASMAGKSMTEAIQAAQGSGNAFQGAGLLQAQGIDAGVFGQGLATQMARGGGLSRAQRTRLGGTSGMADRFAEISQSQLAGGLDAFLPYLVQRGEDGKLGIDQSKLRSFQSGSISMNEMLSQGASGMDSKTLQDLVNNMSDLRVQLADKLGPSGALVATMRNVERVQTQLGGPSMSTFQTAARSMGLSADAATQLEGLRNDPNAMNGVMRSQDTELRRLRYEDQQRDAGRRAMRRTQGERFRDSIYNAIPGQNDVMDAYNDAQADFQRSVDGSMEDARLGELGLRAQRRNGGVDRLLEDSELNRSALFERGLATRTRRSSRRVGGTAFNAAFNRFGGLTNARFQDAAGTQIADAYDAVTTGDANTFLYGQNAEQMAILDEFGARGTTGINQYEGFNQRQKYRSSINDLQRVGNAAIDVKQRGPAGAVAMTSEAEAALDKAGITDPAERRRLLASITAKLSSSTRSNSSLLSGRRSLQFNEVSSAVDEALSESGVSSSASSAAREALLSDAGQRGIMSNLTRFDTRAIESVEKTADSASKFRNATNRREYDGASFKSAQSAMQGIGAKYGMGGVMSSKLSVNEQEAVKMVHAARKDKDLPNGEGAIVLVLVATAVVDGDGEIEGDSTAIRTFQEMTAAAAKEDKAKAKALDRAFDRYSARMVGMYADRGSRPTVVAISKLRLDSVATVQTTDSKGNKVETYDTSAIAAATEEVSGAAAAVSRAELGTKTKAMFRGTALANVGSGDGSFAEDLRSTLTKTTNKDEQAKILDMLKRNNASPQVIAAVQKAFETNDASALTDSTVSSIAQVIMGEGGKNVTAEGGVATETATTQAAEGDAAGLAMMAASTTFQAAVDKFGQYVDQSASRGTMDTLNDVSRGTPLNYNDR